MVQYFFLCHSTMVVIPSFFSSFFLSLLPPSQPPRRLRNGVKVLQWKRMPQSLRSSCLHPAAPSAHTLSACSLTHSVHQRLAADTATTEGISILRPRCRGPASDFCLLLLFSCFLFKTVTPSIFFVFLNFLARGIDQSQCAHDANGASHAASSRCQSPALSHATTLTLCTIRGASTGFSSADASLDTTETLPLPPSFLTPGSLSLSAVSLSPPRDTQLELSSPSMRISAEEHKTTL